MFEEFGVYFFEFFRGYSMVFWDGFGRVFFFWRDVLEELDFIGSFLRVGLKGKCWDFLIKIMFRREYLWRKKIFFFENNF